jgi:hypothetical protein
MDHIIIKADRSPDSEAFFRLLDLTGLDPADLKPDPEDGPDVMDIALKAMIATAPRATVDPAFFKAPSMDDDVDEDNGELDPPLVIQKIGPETVSALSDWRADFLKRVGFSEPTGNTLKKRLGIVSSTIRRDEDGTAWLRGFNAAGEMVDCRTLIEVKE